MKKTFRNEDVEIRDFLVQMHEYQMAQIPPREVLEETYLLSDIFYQRIERLLKAQEKKAKFRELRRGLAAAAAVAVILFSVANPQYVIEAAEKVVQWFSDHVSYNFYEGKDVNVFPRHALGYVPEGYVLEVSEYYDGLGVEEYVNEYGETLSFVYAVTSSETNLDNEEKDYIVLEGSKGETIHYLRAWDGEESSMMWVNEDKTIDYCIMGIFSEEELLKIQESLYIVEE
ncbi:MAG: DUF4367 domain-containing protein [Lachnospiraceae bacterium]|nr:DUF4367 domain-containing protein [Lachnospiraceae bacterium]